MTDKVDYVEVGRAAHELEAARGSEGACRYAARLAQEALAEQKPEDHAFWRAVERSFTVR